MIKIAPSILAADFSVLGAEVVRAEAAGADMLHLDIMDGHFVPNITFGVQMVKTVRRLTKLPLDVHLMVTNPDSMVKDFAAAGADIISFHVETCHHVHRTIASIKELGKIPAVALNPATPPQVLTYILDLVGMVLLMTVNPGFGGQRFIPQVLPKIEQVAGEIRRRGLDVALEVDGGIGPDTARLVTAAGADVLVAGSAVFGSNDVQAAIAAIRQAGVGGGV
ncbi:MAG: ribulose-phosphate 3-epimerase [Firmicutes bacterium]|jgi:ribulose-phosphate 3-epimerase|nr:ribulose-phosphate 3-epimerase [Bacillota bacterium]